MKLHNLSLGDRAIFKKYLDSSRHDLSVYSFANIYIWKPLFDISWSIINKSLCVFFRDKIGAFLYLTPLCARMDPAVIEKIFDHLDGVNKNSEISRIENVEENDLGFFESRGFECRQKSVDYVCLRQDLAGLSGDKFRHKRACANYFTKNFEYEFAPYGDNDAAGCVKLYKEWARQRVLDHADPLYRAMLGDSFKAFKFLLEDYQKLKCAGFVIKIEGRVRGLSFGFKLNEETFCVLYEITDLSIKGMAQFISRAFSQTLRDFKYINIMDDSGLENLKKVKLSYRPVKLVPAYIVTRK